MKRTTKKEVFTRWITLKVSEKQYQDLKTLKELSGQNMSTMMRNNIAFLLAYYKPKT